MGLRTKDQKLGPGGHCSLKLELGVTSFLRDREGKKGVNELRRSKEIST